MRAFARRLALPAIAAGLGIVVASAAVASKPDKTRSATVLTEQSHGAVTTTVGTPVEIRLESQAGTGFSWVPKQWASLITPMPPLPASAAMPGGTQVQRFRFVSKSAGTFPVTFSYDQPWRGGTKGARTRTFLIIVR